MCYEYAAIPPEKNILEVNSDFDFTIKLPQYIPLLFDVFRYGDQSDGGKTLALYIEKRIALLGTNWDLIFVNTVLNNVRS